MLISSLLFIYDNQSLPMRFCSQLGGDLCYIQAPILLLSLLVNIGSHTELPIMLDSVSFMANYTEKFVDSAIHDGGDPQSLFSRTMIWLIGDHYIDLSTS